jgi:hypothetical protein
VSDIIVTLIGSFAGVYLALLASRMQENKNNKDLLVHFSSLIDDIVSSTKKQMENVKDLSIKLIDKPLKIHLIGMVATLDYDRMKTFDSNTLYKTYNHYFKKSIDEFKRTFAYGDYLGIAMKDFISRNEKHISFKHNDQIFIRDNIEKLIYNIGMYITEIQETNPEYSSNSDFVYLSPFMKRLSELTKNEINDLSIYESDILTPLNNSILQNLSNRKIREKLFHIVKQSKNRLDGIRYNSLEFANSLTQDFDTLEIAVIHLERISKKIKQI